MKKNFVIFFSSLLILSCSSNQKKTQSSISSPKYIKVLESANGFSSAYTEDGHTIIYETDSANNYIVYYAKFDDNAGKKGYDRVKEKAVRIEIDSSMNNLTSVVSAYGGAFCQIDKNGVYQVYYFDEQMHTNNIELHEIRLKEQSESIESLGSKTRRIIDLLTIAHDIAKNINDCNIGGWNYIVSALEPSHCILNYNVMNQDTVYETKAEEHISKLRNTTKGLTQLYTIFLKYETN